MSESTEQKSQKPDRGAGEMLVPEDRVADADSSVHRRASRGSAQQMLEILSQAPRVEPEANDRLPTRANG